MKSSHVLNRILKSSHLFYRTSKSTPAIVGFCDSLENHALSGLSLLSGRYDALTIVKSHVKPSFNKPHVAERTVVCGEYAEIVQMRLLS